MIHLVTPHRDAQVEILEKSSKLSSMTSCPVLKKQIGSNLQITVWEPKVRQRSRSCWRRELKDGTRGSSRDDLELTVKLKKRLYPIFDSFRPASLWMKGPKFFDQNTMVCTVSGVAGTVDTLRLYGLTTSNTPFSICAMNQFR